jgi:outer membrane protein assembly factor BamB
VSGNLACDAGSVYIAGGSECHRLDASSGEIQAVYQTPADADGSRRDWAFLAVNDGLLFGSAASRTGFSTKVFAFDVASGKLRWQANRPEIRDTTLVVSNGRLLFVEKRPSAARPAADTPPKLDRRGEPIPPGTNLRTVMALDAATGKLLWEKQVDLTDCGRWENGTWGLLQALCKDDVLVLAGAYTIYGRRTDLTPRQAMALSAKDGTVLWTSVVENRSRPIVMQGALLAEPLFYDLHKGTKILKPQGNRQVPWTMGPRTGGCGPLSASDCMVFGRGGYTIWRNVAGGPSGTFVGTRPGCAINIIPAGGVVVQAEASSGCSCYQAVQCTVVFRPRE